MLDINEGIFFAAMVSFADDTWVWYAIKSHYDAIILQDELNLIYHWAEQNNMLFNEDKFELAALHGIEEEEHAGHDGVSG